MRCFSAFESALIRLGSVATNRGGDDAALAILIFHRVLPTKDSLLPSEPDAADFSTLMDLVRAHFDILGLSEAVRLLRDGRLPPRAVCITFDDGYANNHDVAFPILTARRIPATVFVASGFLDGRRMFNDTVIEAVRRAPSIFDLRDIGLGSYELADDSTRAGTAGDIIRAVKHLEPSTRARTVNAIAQRVGLAEHSELMMTREQVRHLHRAGIEIGAHTVTHPILCALDSEIAKREIIAGKQELEMILGAPVKLFAFPNGKPRIDYDSRHVAMVAEAGFEAAFSTAWGAADRRCDFLQMPRIAPWGKTPLRYALQMVASYRQRNYVRA